MNFGHKGNLRLHRKVEHEGKTIKCDLGDFQAAKRSRVEEHKKTDQEGIRYKCDQCEFETKVKKYLTYKCTQKGTTRGKFSVQALRILKQGPAIAEAPY